MISNEEQQKIVAKLSEKIKNIKCPMCGNNHFEVQNGYQVEVLHDDFKNIQVIGENLPAMPVISAYCSNCGFISSHNLKVLGLYE